MPDIKTPRPSNADAAIKHEFEAILTLEEEIANTRLVIKEHKASLKGLGVKPAAATKVVARMKKAREEVLEADDEIARLEKILGLEGNGW